MGNMCSCSILCGAALGSFTLSLFRRMGRQNSDEWMQCKETFAYLHYVHGTISIYACQSVSQILGRPAQIKWLSLLQSATTYGIFPPHC